MRKPRQNEKKFHGELVDIAVELHGWGYKAQRNFIKGVPDVELKVPNLPLVKLEVKHEVFLKMPSRISVNLTELQRKRLRDMQKVGIACGWAVFVTVDKKTWIVYGFDMSTVLVDFPLNPNLIRNIELGSDEWRKNNKLAVVAAMLARLTRLEQS